MTDLLLSDELRERIDGLLLRTEQLVEERDALRDECERKSTALALLQGAAGQVRDIGRFPITEGGTVSASAYSAICRAFSCLDFALSEAAKTLAGGGK